MAKRIFRKGGGSKSGSGERMKFRGLVSYAKVYEPDDYLGVKKWKVNLHPDEETIQAIKDAGIQLKLKDSNEEWSGVPGKYFTFNRPCEKEFEDGVTYFSPPAIYDADGEAIVEYKEVDNGWEQVGDGPLIGNGSDVELDVTIYKTKRFGKGQRINYLKVFDLIEYVPDEDVSENEADGDEDAPFDGGKKVEQKAVKKTTTARKKSSKVDW